jgi:predicted Rossmann fold flavoprotein
MADREAVIIVGGGAAGMMAALAAQRSHPSYKIILVDHEEKLGRKLLVCGAGRCNVTNVNVTSAHFSGAPQAFIEAVLTQFDHTHVQNFFADLGIALYEEKKNNKGKLFPVTNQAHTVHALLIDELERAGVEIRTGVHVQKIHKDDKGFALTTKKGPMWASYVILAAGGKTYPKLGGDGSGYALAQSFGHNIIEPVPTALPLLSANPLAKLLAGVRAEMEVAAIIGGQEVARDTDQMMFAKTGFTGPAILNVSRPISLRMHREDKDDCELELKFLPGKSAAEISAELAARWNKRPEQRLSISLAALMERKMPDAILKFLEIPDTAVRKLTAAHKKKLLAHLSGWRVKIDGTRGWDEGEFTAGGIDCNEVETGTLVSKRVPGLYFAGELLDVDGEVGGFNLTWAWASGHVAGQLS